MLGFFQRKYSRFLIVGISDPGRARSGNEDCLCLRPADGILAVADGMGGAAAGEVASAIFVEEVKKIPSVRNLEQAEGLELVKDVFMSANQAILDHVRRYPQHRGMGCTAELLIFCTDGYIVGHVGDSRTYLFRNGVLKRLTKDHTVVQDQLDRGLLSIDEAERHPMRNVILRAVGVDRELSLDLIRGKTRPGDIFLLCSDGLTDMISEVDITNELVLEIPLEEQVRRLVRRANEAGGRDNITVALGKVV